jgi:hypothetical protein
MDCQWWSSTPAREPQDGPIERSISMGKKIFCTLVIEIWDMNQARPSFLSDFFCTFLFKKNVETKRWHKMRKSKHKIVAYEISIFFVLISRF